MKKIQLYIIIMFLGSMYANTNVFGQFDEMERDRQMFLRQEQRELRTPRPGTVAVYAQNNTNGEIEIHYYYKKDLPKLGYKAKAPFGFEWRETEKEINGRPLYVPEPIKPKFKPNPPIITQNSGRASIRYILGQSFNTPSNQNKSLKEALHEDPVWQALNALAEKGEINFVTEDHRETHRQTIIQIENVSKPILPQEKELIVDALNAYTNNRVYPWTITEKNYQKYQIVLHHIVAQIRRGGMQTIDGKPLPKDFLRADQKGSLLQLMMTGNNRKVVYQIDSPAKQIKMKIGVNTMFPDGPPDIKPPAGSQGSQQPVDPNDPYANDPYAGQESPIIPELGPGIPNPSYYLQGIFVGPEIRFGVTPNTIIPVGNKNEQSSRIDFLFNPTPAEDKKINPGTVRIKLNKIKLGFGFSDENKDGIFETARFYIQNTTTGLMEEVPYGFWTWYKKTLEHQK